MSNIESENVRRPRISTVTSEEIPVGPMTSVEPDDIQPPPHYSENGPPQVITADTARQAPLGPRVLFILVASVIAIVVAFALIAIWMPKH